MSSNWVKVSERMPESGWIGVVLWGVEWSEIAQNARWTGEQWEARSKESGAWTRLANDVTYWLDFTPQPSQEQQIAQLVDENPEFAYYELSIRFRLDTDDRHYSPEFETMDEAIGYLEREQVPSHERALQACNDLSVALVGKDDVAMRENLAVIQRYLEAQE